MKRLAIDFAPRSLRRTLANTHPVAWLAILLTLAVALHLALAFAHLSRQRHRADAALHRVQAALSKQAAQAQSAPTVHIAQAQADAVNHAITQLNLPWRVLFDAVEAATPPTIALLALEPNAAKQFVKGTAEAKTSEAMIAYIETLKRQPFFTGVLLIRHEVNAQDANRPFRFQFEAQWEDRR